MKGFKYNNRVVQAHMNCKLDLKHICMHSSNAIFQTSPFSQLVLRSRKIPGTCLIFASGFICYHAGSADNYQKYIRQFMRLIARLGYPVRPTKPKVVTASFSCSIEEVINYDVILKQFPTLCQFEPELFHPLTMRVESANITIFMSGKIVVVGVKNNRIKDLILDLILNVSLILQDSMQNVSPVCE